MLRKGPIWSENKVGNGRDEAPSPSGSLENPGARLEMHQSGRTQPGEAEPVTG